LYAPVVDIFPDQIHINRLLLPYALNITFPSDLITPMVALDVTGKSSEVALATPNVGVTNTGLVEKTRFVVPVPVVPVAPAR
jgi:hypothetical protein